MILVHAIKGVELEEIEEAPQRRKMALPFSRHFGSGLASDWNQKRGLLASSSSTTWKNRRRIETRLYFATRLHMVDDLMPMSPRA